ncbi:MULTISPECIES: N-acetyl-alpha-D-glucosaminyl L-malate synthase BshA [Bacillaceae]|uniref:N-acetyl-alpha-D-glucosaminyl L-malate synthase BshA n=1 Tax=Evansella alkalicola TaxID=745819 RepID=A0ABS6JZA3_9BACI|nr:MULTISPECIES: N-acetyl-alpha-D-glucosaminyl L-malate synthase BshA [Bacillaceae]MBU9723921.1 N-acetyl-alpha-D-glucosaminyl L-malate synthase BshA [Bacillus alkalicola]
MRYKIGITCYPTVGGSGVVATELGKALAEKGHQVHFITSSIPFRLNGCNENIYFHEVEVNQYSVFRYPPYDIALASKMAEIAKREELDILHVHYAIPHAISAFLAKEMVGDHLKVVTTLHGTDITVLGYDPSLSDMIRFGIERSDKVTAVSNDLVKQTQDLLSTEKDISTIYNFIDDREYSPKRESNFREALGISSTQKVIIHISNFRKVKRAPDVIQSFYEIQKDIDSVLLLVGEGPDLPVIQDQAKRLGILHKIKLLGSQKRIAELLAICDLKLLLSEKESFGLVLLEAMACGVPVIGTNIGGIPEVIEDGKNGFICPLGDIESITKRAIQILTDDKLHQEMSEYAVNKVTEDFHLEKIVRQYEDIYHQALEGL